MSVIGPAGASGASGPWRGVCVLDWEMVLVAVRVWDTVLVLEWL